MNQKLKKRGRASETAKQAESFVREGEKPKFWFRSDRFFTVDNQWYFSTREHLDLGPFASRELACQGLDLFVDSIQQGVTPEHAASIAKRGEWAVSRFY